MAIEQVVPSNTDTAERCESCESITMRLDGDGDAKWCCRCGAKLRGNYVSVAFAKPVTPPKDLRTLGWLYPVGFGTVTFQHAVRDAWVQDGHQPIELIDKAHYDQAVARQTPEGMIAVDAKALGTVLRALVNAPHQIRELQVTRGPLFPDNPITVLVDQFNSEGREE